VNQTQILSADDLNRMYHLHQDLTVQLRQLELYYYELQSLVNPQANAVYDLLRLICFAVAAILPRVDTFKPFIYVQLRCAYDHEATFPRDRC
jgi:hypothetical protein